MNESAYVNMVEVCLHQILNNSPSKIEYANNILDIVRNMDKLMQAALEEIRSKS